MSEEQVEIKCIYFKESGKYKYDGQGKFEKALFKDCIYPKEFGERLRELRRLPGIMSGYWEGPFTVEVVDLYTELVPATS